MAFNGSFSTSMSESSSASEQYASNQDFSKMFGAKNLGKTDYVAPGLLAVGFVGLYIYLKSKGMV